MLPVHPPSLGPPAPNIGLEKGLGLSSAQVFLPEGDLPSCGRLPSPPIYMSQSGQEAGGLRPDKHTGCTSTGPGSMPASEATYPHGATFWLPQLFELQSL